MHLIPLDNRKNMTMLTKDLTRRIQAQFMTKTTTRFLIPKKIIWWKIKIILETTLKMVDQKMLFSIQMKINGNKMQEKEKKEQIKRDQIQKVKAIITNRIKWIIRTIKLNYLLIQRVKIGLNLINNLQMGIKRKENAQMGTKLKELINNRYNEIKAQWTTKMERTKRMQMFSRTKLINNKSLMMRLVRKWTKIAKLEWTKGLKRIT